MFFIYSNAIITLILFILVQVQTIYELLEQKDKKDAYCTIFSLVMYVVSLYCITISLLRYTDIIIYKFLQISCTTYFILSTICIFFKAIIFKKYKYKILKYTNMIFLIEQIFIIVALNWRF